MDIKKIVRRYLLLSYPNFNDELIIHTYGSKMQLGGLIRKTGYPLNFTHAN